MTKGAGRRWQPALIAVGALFPAVLFLVNPAAATPTPGSLYSYTFAGATASPVGNGAATNVAVPLTLFGTWTPSSLGIHFVGDKVSKRSVGFAKPASGPTLSAAANDAVGAAVKFQFEGPASGTCLKDTRNITQIGRFAYKVAQFKLQLSSCAGTSAGVFAECRIVGSNSTNADLPKRGTQALVNGATYVVKCFKGPDPATGLTTLTLQTTKIDAVNGNVSTVDTFAITRPGAMVSSEYLSIANKYPLPGQTSNTDQFNGDMAKVAYCKTAAIDTLLACLDTEVPTRLDPDPSPSPSPIPTDTASPSPSPVPTDTVSPSPTPTPTPTPPPGPTEYVTNRSVENGSLTGWLGIYNAKSQVSAVQPAGGAVDGTWAIRVTNSGTAAQAVGFQNAQPFWVTNTTAGTPYTGSVWVKGASGTVVTLMLRECTQTGACSGYTAKAVTVGTGWVQVATTFTPVASGNQVRFYVYASSVGAGQSFFADQLSETSP